MVEKLQKYSKGQNLCLGKISRASFTGEGHGWREHEKGIYTNPEKMNVKNQTLMNTQSTCEGK